MIEVGYLPTFKVVNNKKIKTIFITWTLDDRELTKLNAKCLNFFSMH